MYIGTKIVDAYKAYRGKRLSDGSEIIVEHSDPNMIRYMDKGYKDGYKVIYEDGYTSWSPKEVFEKAYRRIDNMTFGLAIEAMKKGLAVCRKGWNGKKMWLCLYVPALDMAFKDGTSFPQSPYIIMKTADGKIVPWLASQTDMLAEDWQVVE